MKKGWEYETIKEIGTVIGGTTPSTNNKEYWDGEHCWISPAELDGSHYLYDSVRKVTDKAVKDKNLKLLPIGTVILSSRAPIGKVTINKIPTYCNQGFKCVICGNRVYNEFLYWWFWGKTEYLNSIGTGATFKEISKKVVENIIIPVPPLSEQKEIVEYLDSSFAKIDKLKENAAKNLEEAKALFQSALKDALEPKEGWEEKTLKEVANYRRGSFPQPYGNSEWYDGEDSMPFVQVAELQEDSFALIMPTKKRISKLAQPLSVFVPEGIVLVSLQGSIGKVGITQNNCYVDRTVAIFQSYKLPVDSHFFAYQLKERFAIERLKARGTTIKTITKEEFANFTIMLPPLSEQQSIVSFLDSLNEKVNTLQQNYSRICDECDALKQAILRQVFE